MAKKSKMNEKELATLALAKALVEGDTAAARTALSSGANPEAFWIDGKTTLRKLAKERGPASISKAIEKLLAPEALRKLPSMKDAPGLWTEDFVLFVAKCGHGFHGETRPLAGGGGSSIRPVNTAKSAVRLIQSKWKLLEDANCETGDNGKSTNFRLLFDAQWNVDRRIVGFVLKFKVDSSEWDLVEAFEAAHESGRQAEWPGPMEPMAISQKNWEGMALSYQLLVDDYKDADDIIRCLRKGGSPFFTHGGKMFGEFDSDSPEDKAFMDALREAVGPQDGWHQRIVPMLTAEGIKALQAKAALNLSTPQGKARKKSLKDRADII